MKAYLKILAITASIQLLGFLIAYGVDFLLKSAANSTIFPIFIIIIAVLSSLILGIVLPIRWCNNRLYKIVTILLLPTNYTWIFIIFGVIKIVKSILDILESIPPNFG